MWSCGWLDGALFLIGYRPFCKRTEKAAAHEEIGSSIPVFAVLHDGCIMHAKRIACGKGGIGFTF
jgi:hypothetical protein